MNKVISQSGQVVLLIVMLVAVITTVALTLSFRAQTDVQQGNLNTQAVALREAAEGGVELGFTIPSTSAVMTYTQLGYNTSSNPLPGVNLNKSRIIISNNASDQSIVSQVLSNNGMFTFYLVPVTDVQTMAFQDTNFGRDLDIFYSDSGGTCNQIALEFTIIGDVTPGPAVTYAVIPRFIADSGNLLDLDSTNDIYQGTASQVLPIAGGTTTFRCWARIPAANLDAGRVLFVRMLTPTLNRQTRIGFRARNLSPLPVQKRSVRSEVWSTDGVLSITVADQSYPQLPADFFVTSF